MSVTEMPVSLKKQVEVLQIAYKDTCEEVKRLSRKLAAYEETELTPDEIGQLRVEHTEYEVLKEAFELACSEMADHQCPFEFDLVVWDKCKSCPKDSEARHDAKRDIECWKQYYLGQAIFGKGEKHE